ncbi:uncharacterized protein A1O5_04142 [Cladophialophora psammophila CBS 110553]|uniref:Uncharacterized protein n=1 Tax=Cladophialophora psammophila CBS 110553 TaxID=1182543 RepID=W9WYH3_9EURO|nr:uncharacterized protein A1O5_04142 [Cladophialophora psammophila CBS 110553]EXJ72993.1 hypothetical protein A1O5_04142 [Cladophialophora psammophila CBS 110553]
MDLNDRQDETANSTVTDLNSPPLENFNGHHQEPENTLVRSIQPVKDVSGAASFYKQKWNRLREHYLDQYLEIFKETFESADEDYLGGDLPPTQLGAALWRSDEKARLYDALCRKGRHELKTLSSLVGTKSEVEINAYLDHLREHEADRQRFEAQPKNISHAEIPAAIEIGRECEAVLDRAAAALLAFQEQFDATVGQKDGKLWLIDHEAAAELDRRGDELEASGNIHQQESDDSFTPFSERAARAFHLSTFLMLSERFFMNRDADNPESWSNIAEEGQRPALTLDCVTLFYDLVINFARRLIQSSLFIATSRVRAAASKDYQPGRLVKSQDVLAALDVLGVEKDSESYWIGLARRNELSVVDDPHRRGVDGKAVMPYEKVEEILSSHRRTRSGPRTSTTSTRSQSPLERFSSGEDLTEDNIDTLVSDAHEQSSADTTYSDAESEGQTANSPSKEENGSSSEERLSLRMSREKRIQILQENEDRYLGRMDREARRREESRLSSLLGVHDEQETNEQKMEDLGVRPRVLRKSVEDCTKWSVRYEAEWERNGRMLESLVEPTSKKRRIDLGDGSG